MLLLRPISINASPTSLRVPEPAEGYQSTKWAWGARLIEKHGREGNLMAGRETLNADCPKRDGCLNERCDLICPDLPKVVYCLRAANVCNVPLTDPPQSDIMRCPYLAR